MVEVGAKPQIPEMKGGKEEETTCLLDIAGKGIVIAYRSPVHKPVIKGGKEKKKLPAGWRKGHCPCKRK